MKLVDELRAAGGEARGEDGSGGASADDDDVLGAHGGAQSAGLGGGPSWMRSPMYAPMRVNIRPMAARMT